MQSGLGSGPYPSGSGSGFYSVHQYKDLLQYAKNLHIEVIPEIDLPAHAHAAIIAMKRRYFTHLKNNQELSGREYLLNDFYDDSVYYSVQHFKNNVVNPCMPSTYNFIEKVIKELVSMHSEILPLKTIHVGGDEVVKSATERSPQCISLHNLNVDSIKEYFIQELLVIGAKYGVKLQVWEEGAFKDDHATPLDRNIYESTFFKNKTDLIANGWVSKWSRNMAYRAYELANSGYKVRVYHI